MSNKYSMSQTNVGWRSLFVTPQWSIRILISIYVNTHCTRGYWLTLWLLRNYIFFRFIQMRTILLLLKVVLFGNGKGNICATVHDSFHQCQHSPLDYQLYLTFYGVKDMSDSQWKKPQRKLNMELCGSQKIDALSGLSKSYSWRSREWYICCWMVTLCGNQMKMIPS